MSTVLMKETSWWHKPVQAFFLWWNSVEKRSVKWHHNRNREPKSPFPQVKQHRDAIILSNSKAIPSKQPTLYYMWSNRSSSWSEAYVEIMMKEENGGRKTIKKNGIHLNKQSRKYKMKLRVDLCHLYESWRRFGMPVYMSMTARSFFVSLWLNYR